MSELTQEMRTKFIKFHEAYSFVLQQLLNESSSASEIAAECWEAALQDVPLTPQELQLYRRLVARHSMHGGELFEA